MKSTNVILVPCIGWNRSLLMVRKAQRGYQRMIQTQMGKLTAEFPCN
ncbi:hypothetical protein Golob_006738, partial [Gossypium lobatum]|nr:hypothetical protein [Gossypium lobatum]